LYVFHLREAFGLFVSPIYNWYAHSSGFNRELNSAVSGEARPASSLLLTYGVTAGAEAAPIYGKFALYDELLARFSIVLRAGAGVGGTEHELQEGSAFGPTTYGDTGPRLLVTAGAGFRFQVGTRFTLRLEISDLAYSAKVDRVDGCGRSDLTALVNEQSQGQPLSAASVSGGCQVKSFQGAREADLRNALDLVSDGSSAVLNNVGFYAGLGVVF
jgi:hypothetical protein